jgi:hypothetical protein
MFQEQKRRADDHDQTKVDCDDADQILKCSASDVLREGLPSTS